MKRVLLVVGVLLAASAAWVVRRYRSTIDVAPYDLAVRSIEENAAEGARIGAKPVQIGTLRALIRPPTSGGAWFIYWAGNTSTYFKESVDTVAGLALPEDIGVLIVAPPGYDGSEGHPSPENVPVAAIAARDWLVKEQRAEKIVTGGFSMGTLSAIAAATDAMVLLSVPTLFESQDPGRFIRLRAPVQYRPPDVLPKVKALVLHGENDDGFPIQMGRDVATKLGARFVALPGVGHVDLQTHAAGLSEARAFVITSLQ